MISPALQLLVLLHMPVHATTVDSAQVGIEQLAAQVHQSLINRQALFTDLPLIAHCEELLDRLFPGQADAFAIYVTRDHRPLAFSLPDGRIYLSAGLFLLIETEAELAFVLAHEAAHILGRHSRHRLRTTSKVQRNEKSSGFVAEFELQADRVAGERMLRAGLGLSTIGDFVQNLGQIHGQSSDARAQAELNRRINQLRSMVDIELGSSGDLVALITAATRAAALQRLLDLGQWQAVLDCMPDSCSATLPVGLRHRLWADALRISGLRERASTAIDQYRGALKLAPSDWQAWLGLALLQDRLQDCQGAQQAWQKALQLAPATTPGIALWRSRLEHSQCDD